MHPDLVGLGTHLGPFGALVTAGLIWTLGLLLATWLERTGRPGPLEKLMGCLVDGKSGARRQ